MMKKILFILLTIAMLCTTSCSDKQEPSISHTTEPQETQVLTFAVEDPGWYGQSPLIGTIRMSDVAALKEFINNEDEFKQAIPDYAAVYPEVQSAYEHLRDTLKARKLVVPTCYDKHPPEISLFPEARYEDVGVNFTYTCDGGSVMVFIYYVKSGYEGDSSVREYWDWRFGTQYKESATDLTIERDGKSVNALTFAHGSGKGIAYLKDGYVIKILHGADMDSKALAEAFEYNLVSLVVSD